MEIKNTARLNYLYKVMQYKPGIDLSKVVYDIISEDEFSSGNVRLEIFKRLSDTNESKDYNKKTSRTHNVEKGINEKPSTLNVLLIPKSIAYKISYNGNSHPEKTEELKDTTGIFYVPAKLDENGHLMIPENNDAPWIPYEFQKPFDADICICNYKGNIHFNKTDSKGDNQNTSNEQSWKLYYKEVVRYYEELTDRKWQEDKLPDYNGRDFFFPIRKDILICLDKSVNAGSALCHLYSKLNDYKNCIYKGKNASELVGFKKNDNERAFILLNSILNDNEKKEEGKGDLDTFCMKEHLGTMSSEFPLAISQRETVHNINNSNLKNEVLAVSGPPGTGKTTMLQAIVADLIVKKVLSAKKESNANNTWKAKMPIIAATSTNNKAIKNIIDSFTDVFKIEGAKKGTEVLCRRWIPELKSLAVYFPSSTQVNKARKEGYFIDEDYRKLDRIENKTKLVIEYTSYVHKYQTSLDKLKDIKTDDKGLGYIAYCLQGKIKQMQYSLKNIVDLINDVLSSLTSKERQAVRTLPIGKIKNKNAVAALKAGLVNLGEKYDFDILETLLKIAETYHPDDGMEFKVSKENFQEIKTQNTIEDIVDKMRLQDINGALDMTLRCHMFWLSIHFFEAIWLQTLEDHMHWKKYMNSYDIREKIQDQALATPCFVATFFSLPNVFKSNSNDQFPYFHDIDLLIVDEAGQVSPEVSVPCFSLAKKALVVGDACQIPPVWKLSDPMMDLKIANYEGYVNDDSEEYLSTVFSKSEFNCSNSSLMRIAQAACPITKDGKVGGLYLTEHRRCLKEIIEFCNTMMYNGILEPRRADAFIGNKFLGSGTYPMSRLVCEHPNSNSQGGSRVSREEADAICNWLIKNYLYIKNDSCYKGTEKKPFNPTKVISIITPFKAQANLIKSKLKEAGEKDQRLKTDFKTIANEAVGTVHTFQGAESKIVIFSTVYGSCDSWTFINNNPNLVNVAVSRAKDYFILCGASYRASSNKEKISKSMMSDEEKSQNFISNPNIVNQFNGIEPEMDSKENTNQKPQDLPAEQLFEAIGEHKMVNDLISLNKNDLNDNTIN